MAAVLAAVVPTAAHAAGGSVSGRVTDSAGAPLAAVCVRLGSSTPYRHVVASSTTADDGTYSVTAAAGSYHVWFEDCGGRDLVLSYWPGAASWPQAKQVTLADGQQLSAIDGSLARGGSVSGVVTDTSGAPVRGVRVDLRLTTMNNFPYPQETRPRPTRRAGTRRTASRRGGTARRSTPTTATPTSSTATPR